jgi:alanine racemase
MVRPTVAKVSLPDVQANLRAIRALLEREARLAAAPSPDIIAVVKANAYGHGALAVARALEDAGASMLACADIEEGVALRDAGVTRPILVFGAQSVSDLDGVFTHRLTPTVSTPGAARALEAAAAARGVRLACHLKIDTGMNRLGFRHDNLRRTLPVSQPAPTFTGVTHPATADDPESAFLGARGSTAPWRRSGLGRCGGMVIRPRCSATRAPGTMRCVPACCSTASSRRRCPRRICRCDLPCHSTAV